MRGSARLSESRDPGGTSASSHDFPLAFRPPLSLRLLLAACGLLCAWAALWQAAQFARTGDPARLAGAVVVGLPCLLAAAVLRRRVEVREEGLHSTILLRTLRVSWEDVRRVDQARCSFVIETKVGPISAGWLAPRDRDRLLRQTLQQARLLPVAEKLRWGLTARYERRRP